MNTYPKVKLLPILTGLLGIAALALRLGLYRFAQDARGLLNPGDPLNIALWAVTGFTAVLVCLVTAGLDGSLKYADNFRPSAPAALGCFALAAGTAVTLLLSLPVWTRLEVLRSIAAALAVPALIWVGICRWRGKRPSFLFHTVVCLYLTFHAVSHYQAWSSRPQLQDYLFAMLASVLLTLFAYYQTAFDVGLGKRRMQLATGLLAAFFCIAALAGGEDVLLYLAGALWALTGLCRLVPVPRPRKQPEEPQDPQTQQESGNAPA